MAFAPRLFSSTVGNVAEEQLNYSRPLKVKQLWRKKWLARKAAMRDSIKGLLLIEKSVSRHMSSAFKTTKGKIADVSMSLCE